MDYYTPLVHVDVITYPGPKIDVGSFSSLDIGIFTAVLKEEYNRLMICVR